MRIGSVGIGVGFPCRVIAELSNAHNGDRDRLGRLIDAAQAAGADLVKFQAYTPAELVALRGDGPAPEPWGSQGWRMRTLYEKAQTPLDWFPKIAAHCARVGMPWFSSVFGPTSLAALEAIGCSAYKVSHFEYQSWDLKGWIRRTGKPWLMSLPHADSEAIEPDGALYCPGGYPAAPSDMKLLELDGWLGLSSHCTHPLVGPVAVARGAKLLEFHFHLEAEPSELEANVSLNERQFAAMVQSVRDTEALLGP